MLVEKSRYFHYAKNCFGAFRRDAESTAVRSQTEMVGMCYYRAVVSDTWRREQEETGGH